VAAGGSAGPGGGSASRRDRSLSTRAYGLGLAAYAGIFLAIGVGEFLAEAHSEPSVARLALTLGGVALMYAVTTLLPG
jgi:zinc transporter ZupT